jgi:hypothetical protein
MRRLAFSLLFVAACTTDNPLYSPSAGMDLASSTPRDLSSASPAADLAMPPTGCTEGKRGCTADKTRSVVCQMGTFVADRKCPTGSVCAEGYCGLPPPGANNSGQSCADPTGGQSAVFCFSGASMPLPDCEPFVQSGAAVWECAPPVGQGSAGTVCAAEAGNLCRSGFCGSNGTCFRACELATDCPTVGGPWACSAVKIIVEGLAVTANSCIPG